MTQPIMLDTNIVSYIVGKNRVVSERFESVDRNQICISAVTYGEILFGLERRPAAKSLHFLMNTFLESMNILAWDKASAESYGVLRADQQRRGKTLERLDLMIAAHSISIGALLITADKAFAMVEGLTTENWFS